ncbi:uncharacterized protein EI90DRAFT_3012177 [Cantharellus anzutake]|uniref:uncharacterized protein n=1 Tax=Cantharellus anzutake TaxID=1750568 RepID=UPI001907B8E7|nr:uncharacterized protein EI90DRAFT_3012177 [Cantharellus anzutake]KAF8341669.1 hypothetical protein EI90DRAFT_3012177 [Cantharellus anzutake]
MSRNEITVRGSSRIHQPRGKSTGKDDLFLSELGNNHQLSRCTDEANNTEQTQEPSPSSEDEIPTDPDLDILPDSHHLKQWFYEEGDHMREDDTGKKSFDFAGELNRLNQGGVQLSFVERLEEVFKMPQVSLSDSGSAFKSCATSPVSLNWELPAEHQSHPAASPLKKFPPYIPSSTALTAMQPTPPACFTGFFDMEIREAMEGKSLGILVLGLDTT